MTLTRPRVGVFRRITRSRESGRITTPFVQQGTMEDLDALVAEASAAFDATSDAAALEQIKARYLGKTGVLTERLKTLGKLPP